MKVPFFDLASQHALLREPLHKAFNEVAESARFIGGDPVKHFESQFASRLQRPVVGVANGTDALFIALKTLGIGPGDEVITPAWSWISSSETISLTGAKPVFVDVNQYFTLDLVDIARKVTPRTRAIVAVHLYGHLAEMEQLVALCKDHDLFLIEDCAQAHLSSEQGITAGCWGDMAAFSFYPTKNLGALGDAGMVVASTPERAQRARRWANHGGLSKDDHAIEGINSRLDTLQAAFLSVKLPHLDHWNAMRRQHAIQYQKGLNGVGDLTLPLERSGVHHTYHLFVIRTKQRDALQHFLADKEIETLVHYPKALPFEPAYETYGHVPAQFPVSFQLQHEVLSLPIYPELSDAQIDYVVEQIQRFFAQR